MEKYNYLKFVGKKYDEREKKIGKRGEMEKNRGGE